MKIILCENLSRDQMDAYMLVLDAYGLPYVADTNAMGGRIHVDEAVYPRALDLIRRYDRENPPDPAPETEDRETGQKTYSAVWVSLLLLAVHLTATLHGNMEELIDVYGASASRILNAEIYRAATALLLHADAAHLTGNIAGIALLGTLVCRITGAGVGWLIILLSGIAGNLVNAALFQHSHVSIGASTALFGALGFLAGYGFRTRAATIHQRKNAWLPLAGGLALLGFLGTSASSDITAHLFGFAAGIVLALFYIFACRRHREPKHQIWCMAVASGILLLSWLWPIDFVLFR